MKKSIFTFAAALFTVMVASSFTTDSAVEANAQAQQDIDPIDPIVPPIIIPPFIYHIDHIDYIDPNDPIDPIIIPPFIDPIDPNIIHPFIDPNIILPPVSEPG